MSERPVDFLRQGDDLFERGDAAGAIEEYLRYCEQLDRRTSGGDRADAHTLRLCAVRKRILELDATRRTVRRSLAEDYIALGLLREAHEELNRVAAESLAMNDSAGHQDALQRLRELAPRLPEGP
jgi:hypothetical protein